MEKKVSNKTIEWEQIMYDKKLMMSHLKGIDQYGNEYSAFGHWHDGSIIEEPTNIDCYKKVCSNCKDELEDGSLKNMIGKKSFPYLCMTCFTGNG
jgi:hypothetical protein